MSGAGLVHQSPEPARWRKTALQLPFSAYLAVSPSPPGPGPCSQSSHHPSTLGIVKSDPKLPDDAILPLPPPRPKNVIFEDEEKSKVRLQGGVDEGSRAHLGVSECQPLDFLPLEQRLRIAMATVLGDRHHLLSSYCMLPLRCCCV